MLLGLRACLSSTAPPPSSLPETLRALVALLPPPPSLLYGETLPAAGCLTEGPTSGIPANDLALCAADMDGLEERSLWSAALACFRCLTGKQVQAAVPVPCSPTFWSPPSVRLPGLDQAVHILRARLFLAFAASTRSCRGQGEQRFWCCFEAP